MRRNRMAIAIAGLALALAGCGPKGGPDQASETSKLVIAWAQWDPAEQLQVLARDFTAETGIEIDVQQIPWDQFEDKVKQSWIAKSPEYDLVVGDSQWLGAGASNGHYLDLTAWARENVALDDIAPAALSAYGEYPEGSGTLWALPCMSDALVFAYRKDLFANPANQEAFQEQYGYPLAPPDNWDQFRDIAAFFTRPDGSMYGAALFYSKAYDGVTMGFQPFLWGFGGAWRSGDRVEGVVNSPEAVRALEFFVGLKRYTPPQSETYYFDECLRDFQNGLVAMSQSWFAFLPGLTDASKNRYADQTGYFVVPAGPRGRYVSLGGQGLSISAYSRHQEAAKRFVQWFSREDVQRKWVELGGLTSNARLAESDFFRNATPYNATFAATVPYLRDFDNSPDYSVFLNETQTQLNDAVAGNVTPKDALDNIARRVQPLFEGRN